MLPLVDAHFHLDLYPQEAFVLQEIRRLNIKVIAVTNAPRVFFHTQNIANNEPLIYPAIGMHPELVADHTNEFDEFYRILTKIKFVGEIGLDYAAAERITHSVQFNFFRNVLVRCQELGNKVLTIHSRGAVPHVLDSLEELYKGKAILHWFTGTVSQAKRAVNLGCYFSVNIKMLQSDKGQQIIKLIPPERIVTESDGPFIKTKGQPSSPLTIEETLRLLGLSWGKSLEECSIIVNDNFSSITN